VAVVLVASLIFLLTQQVLLIQAVALAQAVMETVQPVAQA
jgi:uncharacterized membrane protein